MAEYVCAKITIGGELPRYSLTALWERVLAERAGPEWGLRFRDDAHLAAHLRDSGGGVTFYGDEVRNGEFEHLQAFCADHGLTYLLTYDGCGGEWGPPRRRWRPDDREGVTCALDADGGRACLTADEVRARGLQTVDDILAHLQAFDDEVTPPLVMTED